MPEDATAVHVSAVDACTDALTAIAVIAGVILVVDFTTTEASLSIGAVRMRAHQKRNYLGLVADEQKGGAVVVPQALQFFCYCSGSRGIKACERLVENNLSIMELTGCKGHEGKKAIQRYRSKALLDGS